LTLSAPDEGYFSKGLSALNYISTLLLLSLGRYLLVPEGYYLPGSQSFWLWAFLTTFFPEAPCAH